VTIQLSWFDLSHRDLTTNCRESSNDSRLRAICLYVAPRFLGSVDSDSWSVAARKMVGLLVEESTQARPA
jgi:hypothetical protein